MATSPAEPVVVTSPAAPPFDVLVVGAGPAGLAAATSAARAGAGIRVALLDGAARPGGQYWRHRPGDDGTGHHDWTAFRRLRAELEALARAGLLVHLADHSVWHLAGDGESFTAHVVAGDTERAVHGRTVVIATGAYDRQLPFPGWTLPGVIAAGGAQALLKGHGVVAGRRIVVAGTGPFLLPVAAGFARAGADVAGVFEAGRPAAFLRHPVTAARNADKLAEAAGYVATLARHGVRYRTGRTVVAAHGTPAADGLTAVTTAALDRDWRIVRGSERRVECDTLAVGYGFTPQVELAADLGCATAVDADGSLVIAVDDTQRTSVPGAWAAGETCGVGGSAAALVEGEIAGRWAAAAVTGRVPDARVLRGLAGRRAHRRTFAALLPAVFPVRPGWRTWVRPDTIVCRCEEVPAAAVTAAVLDLGATDATGAKRFARPGMGLCQGRVCGYATAGLVAGALGRDVLPADLAATARRPVAWPVTLGALAAAHAVRAPGSDPAEPVAQAPRVAPAGSRHPASPDPSPTPHEELPA